MAVALHLGPFTIRWYGILLTLAVVAAILLAITEVKRRGEAPEHILNMALIVLPLGIIGARLYHVIDKWDFYSKDPTLIFGGAGLGIFGAIIGGGYWPRHLYQVEETQHSALARYLRSWSHPWTGNRQMG